MEKKSILAVLGLLLLAASPLSAAAPQGWLTSFDAALEKAAASDRMILVDLYAEWCGWCKVLEEKVFTTPEFRDFTRDFVLLRVDVDDGADGSALQARFGLYNLPTTLLMDADRVKIGTVEGFAPMPAFLERLSAEIASYRAFLDFYEQTKASDDLALLYRLSQELHARGDGARAVVVLRQILRQTGEGSPKAAWLHYLIADAYRLAGRFDEALATLEKARALSAEAANRDLSERIDLLSYKIAHDSRDCERAKKSLEEFLAAHPDSAFRSEAKRVLDELKSGRGLACA